MADEKVKVFLYPEDRFTGEQIATLRDYSDRARKEGAQIVVYLRSIEIHAPLERAEKYVELIIGTDGIKGRLNEVNIIHSGVVGRLEGILEGLDIKSIPMKQINPGRNYPPFGKVK